MVLFEVIVKQSLQQVTGEELFMTLKAGLEFVFNSIYEILGLENCIPLVSDIIGIGRN